MDEQTIDRLVERGIAFYELSLQYLSSPEVLFQLGIIAIAVVPAWFLSGLVEKKIEGAVRRIHGMRGLLRVIVAFLRRLQWLFIAVFLGIAYIATRISGWPESNYLIYATMLLSAAWLVISAVSRIIRHRSIAKLFAFVAWVYVAAALLGVTDDIQAILDGAMIPVLEISLWQVATALIAVGVLLWVALKLGNILDSRIQKTEDLTPSLRVLLGKITRISLMVFAVLLGMQLLSINLTALTVLSGAVGVGIGFGLQKVVSNFISGIIILLDQSIKPGDTITLGETFGWIRELRARFVSVVTRDGREYLIPNEDFITTQVVNWSFSNKFVRLDVPFGVSYSSDPHEVIRLAKEAADAVDRVDSRYNPPVCWMTEFGDSSINFLLRFWIDDPQRGLTNIRGTVLLALWDTFKENDINIPFPHREVIMRTPVTVEQGKTDDTRDS
ncbi:MAG TPA: mechanosensitive ion channel domain-containing protein [Wenzhouxiangellaceae bacterium]|nr:mechanosensitive ion channel domain-containing protein [Wenzhouxiangellaceae bacterium]